MRWFAGVHSAGRGEQAVAAVRRLAADGDGRAFVDGPLAVAAADDASTHGGGDLCVIAGRVYGIDELARELDLRAGASPQTALLAGFRRLGPQVLERLRGDFALLLWDAERGSGLVGSDLSARYAIFVKQGGRGAAFATEIRELLRILPSQPGPDPLALARMVGGEGLLPGQTLFSGIQRLRAGSCLVLRGESAEVVEYWRPHYEGTLRGSHDELGMLVRDQLDVAVERALGGATRAGVLLSGGLDSSMVASMAARRGIEVRGYSAVFPVRPELDESRYVESIASKWGIHRSCRPLPPSGSIMAALEYLATWQVPVLGAGYLIEHTLIQEMAQDGPMAMLDGQGGDELFSASSFLPPHLVRHGRLLRSIGIVRRTPSTSTIQSPRVIFEMWKRVALKPAFPLPLIEARRRRRGPPPTPPWLVQSARQLYGDSRDEWAWRRRARGPLWWRWLADLLLEGPVAVGRADYVRHRRGLVGLDGGSPLLDFDLARLVLRMPPELAFDPSIDRPLARRSMRGILPEQVRTRTEKSNLFSFYRDVLAGPDLKWIRRILRDPRCAIWEFADRARVEPLLDSVPAEPDAKTALLLGSIHTMAMVECWLRQQEDPGSVGALLEEMRAAEATPAVALSG
jgi:asparagine synthase (glutamine-hydrolysing)